MAKPQDGSAFALNGYSWPAGSQIKVHLQLTRPEIALQDGSASWNASVADALGIWNQYLDTVQFIEAAPVVPAAGDGENSVFFSDAAYGDPWPPGVLAVTVNNSVAGSGVFTETDVIFNNKLKWDSYRGPLQGSDISAAWDFHRVALHEFGHVLGLGHPDEHYDTVSAIMNSVISDLDHLADDDIAGGQHLYGFRITSPVDYQIAYFGESFSYQLTADNHPTSFEASGLPPGLHLDPATGLITGTTTSLGTFQVTLVAHGARRDVTATLPLTVSNDPHFRNPLTVKGNVGDPIFLPLTTTPEGSIVRFGNGFLPPGLGVYSANTISGAPIIPGSFDLEISAPLPSGTITATLHFDIGPRIHTFQTFLDINRTSAASGIPNLFYTASQGLKVSRDNFNRVIVESNTSATARFQFVAAGFEPLHAGVYDGASPQVHAGEQNALEIFVPYDSSCFQDGAGKFTVKQITYGALGTVLSFWATFEQSCSSRSLTGEIRYHVDSDDPVVLPVVTTNVPGAIQIDQGHDVVFLIHGTNGATRYGANGLPYGMACSPDTGKVTGAPLVSGTFHVRLFAMNDLGAGEMPMTITVKPGPTRPHSLLNVSTRGPVGTGDDIMIGGFIITGTEQKSVVMRGMGPSIPVDGALADPVLDLGLPNGYHAIIDNWINAYTNIDAGADVFAGMHLDPSNRLEAATFVYLAPGQYTLGLSGANNTTGVGLVEAYDISPFNSSIANISTRGQIGGADNVLIGGFILGGIEPTNVVVRGIGPSLSKSGVSGPLPDPTIALHNGNGILVAENDNWRQSQSQQLIATGLAPTDDRESAMLLSLAPGPYTVIVRGKNGATGVGLFEVYNLDAE